MIERKLTSGSIRVLLLLLTCLTAMTCHGALTAAEVARKASDKLGSTSSIVASFTITTDGQTFKGTVKNLGQKFCVVLPQVRTWYNGKNLYTYNARTSETTIITPTARELLESNPLLYVKGSPGAYDYSFSPKTQKGKYVLVLTPRSKKSGITNLTFVIDKSNFQVESITVRNGKAVTNLYIDSFKTGLNIPVSEFEYPKSKYPNSEIVDLR